MNENQDPIFQKLVGRFTPEVPFMARAAQSAVFQSVMVESHGCEIHLDVENGSLFSVKGRGLSYCIALFDKFIEEYVPTVMTDFAAANLRTLREVYTRIVENDDVSEEVVGFAFGVDSGFASISLDALSIQIRFDILLTDEEENESAGVQ